MKKIFEFKKQRNFDNIIEGSFKFFREHIKPILIQTWKQNKLIITILLLSYFINSFYATGSMLNDYFKIIFNQKDTMQLSNFFSNPIFITSYILVIIFSLVFIIKFTLIIIGYIKIYVSDNGVVDENKLVNYVKNNFWSLAAAFFLYFLFTVFVFSLIVLTIVGLASIGKLGIFISILLGTFSFLYLIVFSSLYFQVYLLDEVSITSSFKLTYHYLKNRFWFSLLVLLVLWIIILLLSSVFQAPIAIFTISKGIMGISNTAAVEFSTTEKIILSFFSVISFVGQNIIKILSIIGTTILYFTLKEYHTQEGLLEKLEQIGQSNED